ncbi:MAG: IS4 family transposase, partial [Steroidobacteraceae bacterium]
MTLASLIEGWSTQTRAAVAGRHVLAIQDTSEIHFSTQPKRRRGLGEVGKGNARGVLAHTMVAVDADNGSCLGLVAGSIYNRKGLVRVPHAKRALKDRESKRWAETAQAAKPILAAAAMVTAVSDRESD